MWIQNLHRRIWGRTSGGAGFIVDFYCHKAGLVIEVDGDVHDLQKDEDARRDKTLREMGLQIVRFRNEEIVRNLSAVFGKIIELIVVEKNRHRIRKIE